MRRRFISTLAFLILTVPATARSSGAPTPAYASPIPLSHPALFAPGRISTGEYESHPHFTPDGRTLYFLKSAPDFSFWTIVTSRFDRGGWTTPEVAPFSGRYSDADPFITADGGKCFFISNRPTDSQPKSDTDIWMMEKTPSGWSEPKNLGQPVNSPGSEWFPTVSSDQTLYFGSDRPGGLGATDLYRCRLVDGKYAEPENLGVAINTKFNEFEPLIAPDQSYLIFMTARPDGSGGFDLYISRSRDGAWTQPASLGEPINSSANELSPKISPDGKYFFWTSTRGFGGTPLEKRLSYRELALRLNGPGNGLGDIYQIDWSAIDAR